MASRDGSMPGARSYAQSMGQENFDWAVIPNSRDFVSESTWSDLIYDSIPYVWTTSKIAEA